MKLLTTILFLTSLNAFSGVVPEGITTRSSKVDVLCRGDAAGNTKKVYDHSDRYTYPENVTSKVNTEISFWGEGKVRAKITIKNVMGRDFNFSYVGIDNGFGEYTLYESPNDIASNRPTNIALQIYPNTVTYELKDYKLLNDLIIRTSDVRDWYVYFYCILPKGTDLSFDIKNGWF
ncbi:MAG: hypothetical protein KC478_09980 [Bacteriovoracaceae bacterium]|nr:hypothetical protein [Bacteriovoracaceae bacterium]